MAFLMSTSYLIEGRGIVIFLHVYKSPEIEWIACVHVHFLLKTIKYMSQLRCLDNTVGGFLAQNFCRYGVIASPLHRNGSAVSQ